MKLPDDFQFNQGNLQDFVDCRRRFLLRYLQHLTWPALLGEPALENEKHLLLGAQFHRLAHQYWLGIDAERLSEFIDDPKLGQWWQSFINFHNLVDLRASSNVCIYPEMTLSAQLDGYRCIAKYDLVVMDPQGQVTIYDWKTSLNRPPSNWLELRLQTRLYPYLFVKAGAFLNQNRPISPEQVRLIYWFAAFPDQSEEIVYSQLKYKSDELYLSGTIDIIRSLDEINFTLTSEERLCRFCVYRSLCDRGARAGLIGEIESNEAPQDDFALNLDYEQVAELAF